MEKYTLKNLLSTKKSLFLNEDHIRRAVIRIVVPGKALPAGNYGQMNLFADEESQMARELRELDVMNITPMEAPGEMIEWQKKVPG